MLAILLAEPEAERFAEAIGAAEHCRISAGNYLEAASVVDARGGPVSNRSFDLFFMRSGIEVVPVTLEQVHLARQAYRDFGKGRHRAGLNFGDCLAYALAKSMDEPLLFKGKDFNRTDVESADSGSS